MPKSQTRIELEEKYRKIARRADARLRSLEVLQHDTNYRNATKYAYARAQRDIKAYGGNKRFNTAPPESTASLKKKISDIETFLGSTTSTKRGITAIYKERANTINDRYGTDFTMDDIGAFYESKVWNDMKDNFGNSKTTVKAVGQIQENKDTVLQAIKDASISNLKISDDEILNDRIKDLVAEYGKDLLELL